jgi:regulatory protein
MASVRGAAIRLLSRRDLTAAELRERLLDLEFSKDDIDDAIVRLRQERFLDDGRVAAAHVRTASQIKRRGRLRIRRELEARGIDSVTIAEAMSQVGDDDERATIQAFLTRRRVPVDLDHASRRRLFNQLLRRGFSSDAISKALRGRGDDAV